MLAVGSRAPEFVLQDHTSRDRSLTDLLADGPLVLYFYPADFTPGCTAEACSVRDLHGELQGVGVAVAGISPQDADSHARFRREHGLPFTLLSDPEKVVIRMYEVDGPLGFGVRRATYLIDQDRHIRDAVLADFRVSRHAEFMRNTVRLRKAAGLQSLPGQEPGT